MPTEALLAIDGNMTRGIQRHSDAFQRAENERRALRPAQRVAVKVVRFNVVPEPLELIRSQVASRSQGRCETAGASLHRAVIKGLPQIADRVRFSLAQSTQQALFVALNFATFIPRMAAFDLAIRADQPQPGVTDGAIVL